MLHGVTKESDMTEQLNNKTNTYIYMYTKTHLEGEEVIEIISVFKITIDFLIS